jgi:predicted transcriptional regulator
MNKTSVYLTDDEAARVAALASREGTSQAEVIRRAIRQYEPQRQGDRNFAVVGSGDGPGGSVADIPEEELLEGFGS